jgi:hypothetical protein
LDSVDGFGARGCENTHTNAYSYSHTDTHSDADADSNADANSNGYTSCLTVAVRVHRSPCHNSGAEELNACWARWTARGFAPRDLRCYACPSDLYHVRRTTIANAIADPSVNPYSCMEQRHQATAK